MLVTPKTCCEILQNAWGSQNMLGVTVECLLLPKHVVILQNAWGSQNMLGDTAECLSSPKHVVRYYKMLGAPKTSWELVARKSVVRY